MNDDKQYEKFQKGEFVDKLRILCNDKIKEIGSPSTQIVCVKAFIYMIKERKINLE